MRSATATGELRTAMVVGLASIALILSAAGIGARAASALPELAAPRTATVPLLESSFNPVAPIVAHDGTVYGWSFMPGGDLWIVALDPTGQPKAGWPVTVPGGEPPVLAPDGTVLIVSCATTGACTLHALTLDGLERHGWPAPLPGTTRCDEPLPGPRNDLYLVCDRGATTRRAFRFAMSGPLQRGFPISIAGATRAELLVGDVLHLIQDYGDGVRTVALSPNATFRRSPVVAEVGDSAGGAVGSRGFALAPDGLAFAWGYDTGSASAPGSPVLLSSTLRAFDLEGTRPGWPYVTRLPMSAPSFGAGGTTYVTLGPPASNGQVVALTRAGRIPTGWPARLPVVALSGHVGAGPQSYLDVPQPLIGPDGTLYVTSVAGGGTTVAALLPSGRIRAGWPYRTSLALASACVAMLDTGCGDARVAPFVAPDGTFYMRMAPTGQPSDGGRILALDSGGRVRGGWPFVEPSSSTGITSAIPRPGGGLIVGELTGGLGSTAALAAIDAAGNVLFRTTLIQIVPAKAVVTLADDRSTFSLHVGDRFLLDLGADYDWTVSVGDPGVLARVLNITVIAGAQGVYEAKAPGRTTLSAVGDPPCRMAIPPCAAPSRLFSIDLIVEAP